MRWLLPLVLSVLPFGGCIATVQPAEAGTALGGSWPWAVQRIALASTTDWNEYDPEGWVAQALVRNAHASADLYVGDPSETGTFASGSDHYLTVPAGGAVRIPFTQSNGRTAVARLHIVLASGTASHPVEIVLSATTE